MPEYYITVFSFSILIMLAMILQVHANGRLQKKQKRTFYGIYCTVIFSAVCEFAGVALSGGPDWVRVPLKIVKFLDYTTTPLAAILIVFPLESKHHIHLMKLMLAILGFNALFQAASIFTGWTFYVDSENIYHHGPYYNLYMAVYAAMIVFVAYAYIQYGKRFKNENRIALFAIVLLEFAALFFQTVFSGKIRITYLAIAFCCSLLYIHYIEFYSEGVDVELAEKTKLIDTDALTGLYSRHAYLHALLEYEKNLPLPQDLTIMFLDLNGLKYVNDHIGHDAGDTLLKGAAAVLGESFNEYGRCFRIGGDEFSVFLNPGTITGEEAVRILQENTEKWNVSNELNLSFAVGHVAVNELPGASLHDIVDTADHRMYKNKMEYYQKFGHYRGKK